MVFGVYDEIVQNDLHGYLKKYADRSAEYDAQNAICDGRREKITQRG